MTQGWAIRGDVLRMSVLVAVVLLGGFLVALAVGGAAAAIPVGMGYVAMQRAAASRDPRTAIAMAIGAAMTGAVAVGVRGDPLAAACLVALCCLAAGMSGVVLDSLMAGLATAVSVLIAMPVAFDATTTLLWMLGGGMLLIGVARGLHLAPPALPDLPTDRVLRHAMVMAVSVGLVTFLGLALKIPHAYWAAVTLTVVLRPIDDETQRRAAQRVIGTLAGTALSIGIIVLCPQWAILGALAVCLILMLAYGASGDYVRQVAFLTPTIVLMGPPGSAGLFAAQRALATVIGALLAVGLALLLAVTEARRSHDQEGAPIEAR